MTADSSSDSENLAEPIQTNLKWVALRLRRLDHPEDHADQRATLEAATVVRRGTR
jgi:hypothetical protein